MLCGLVPVDQASKLNDLSGHGQRDWHTLLDDLDLSLGELLFHGLSKLINYVLGSRDSRQDPIIPKFDCELPLQAIHVSGDCFCLTDLSVRQRIAVSLGQKCQIE